MNLEECRAQIDAIDKELVDLFQRRMDVAIGVANYKREHNLPVLDAKREQSKLDSLAAMSRPEYAEFVCELYEKIFALSRAYQNKLLEK